MGTACCYFVRLLKFLWKFSVEILYRRKIAFGTGSRIVDVLLDRRPPLPSIKLAFLGYSHFPVGNRPKLFTFSTFSQLVIEHSINTLSRLPTCNQSGCFLLFLPVYRDKRMQIKL